MATILLVDGTHGRRRVPGLRPGSPLATALVQRGHRLVGGENPESWADAWDWTTALDGMLGHNDQWEDAGRSLFLWLAFEPRTPALDAILSWSHGGQVVAYAMAHGGRLPLWLPIAMPIRADLADTYRAARVRIDRIVQLRSDSAWADPWQWLGSLFDGSWRATRDLPQTDGLLVAPGASHRDCIDPALWEARAWFDLLPAPA